MILYWYFWIWKSKVKNCLLQLGRWSWRWLIVMGDQRMTVQQLSTSWYRITLLACCFG